MIKIVVFSIDIFFDNEEDEFYLPSELKGITRKLNSDNITVSMLSASYDHFTMVNAVTSAFGPKRDFFMENGLFNRQRIDKDYPPNNAALAHLNQLNQPLNGNPPNRLNHDYFQVLDEIKILEHILAIHNKINLRKASEKNVLYVSNNPAMLEIARQKGYSVLDAREPHFLNKLLTLTTPPAVTYLYKPPRPTHLSSQMPPAAQSKMAAQSSTPQQQKQKYGSMPSHPSRQILLFNEDEAGNNKESAVTSSDPELFGPNSGSNTPLVIVPIKPTPEQKNKEENFCPGCTLF